MEQRDIRLEAFRHLTGMAEGLLPEEKIEADKLEFAGREIQLNKYIMADRSIVFEKVQFVKILENRLHLFLVLANEQGELIHGSQWNPEDILAILESEKLVGGSTY